MNRLTQEMSEIAYVIKKYNGTYLKETYWSGDIYQLPGFVVSFGPDLNDAKLFHSISAATSFARKERLLNFKIFKVVLEEKEEVVPVYPSIKRNSK